MGWTLSDVAFVVRKKFLETPLIDVNTPETELQTVVAALAALRAWGLPLSDYRDIVQLYYLMYYHDDEYASKLISGEDDQMQTAKATLFALTGDCEDIHRLYQLAAIALGVPPESAYLMVLFFGDEEKIIGGHATTLIKEPSRYINLDYTTLVFSHEISGIIGYHSRYGNVVAYALLEFEKESLKEEQARYKDPKVFKAPAPGPYKKITVPEHESVRAIKYHLHRSSEHGDEKKKPLYLALGALALGILVGGGLR